ncbi:hypothetical protein FOA52_014110 [Chlamydomonas sp. UWO 241]|nr:hypothetical protein FOA52_014110 [Chlamydomonas sp. UWO 241]
MLGGAVGGGALAGEQLPKAYTSVVEAIIVSLRDSLDAEAFEASEAAVRRKADPAKEAIKTFVSRWRDDERVNSHPSHVAITAAVTELGAFYSKAGARARMTTPVRTSIYGHLDAAEAALADSPSPEPRSKDGLAALFPSS